MRMLPWLRAEARGCQGEQPRDHGSRKDTTSARTPGFRKTSVLPLLWQQRRTPVFPSVVSRHAVSWCREVAPHFSGVSQKANLFCGAAAIRHPLLTSQLPAKTAPPSQRTAQRQRPITFGRAGLPEPVRTAGSVLLRRVGIRSGLAAPADSV